MNRLRDKTHIILIVLVVAFLITIVFEWGMNYLGTKGQQNIPLGSVNGREIEYQDFENRMQQAIEQQKQQTGEDPDETTINAIRDQVWDQMITEILAQEEMDRLGIKVTDKEILNWVYNSPQTLPDPVKKNFIDSTGQFNMSVYQQALASKTPEVQKFWAQVESYLRQLLQGQKLQSVITSSVRVTDSDVMQKFKDDNIFASFNYLYMDAGSVPDDQVQVNDADLRAYYDSHKDEFKTEESAKLKYLVFSDAATAEDSAFAEKQLRGYTKELKKFDPKDSASIQFINANSATKFKTILLSPAM